jgi:hypothetical protein
LSLGAAYMGLKSRLQHSRGHSARVTNQAATQELFLSLIHIDAVNRFGNGAQNIQGNVNWSYLINLAYREGMAPLAYDALRGMPNQLASKFPVSRFQYLYSLAQRRGAQAYIQLQELLETLQEQGIVPIVLKGAALAELAYKDIGLRPFSDLDVLVRDKDLDRTHSALVALGYRFNYQGKPISPPTEPDRRFRKSRQYFRPERHYISIDPHWQLSKFPFLLPINYDAVWERASRVTIAGVPTLALSPEDMLVHHSLDLMATWWYGRPEVKILRDTAQVLRSQRVDWDNLRTIANAPATRPPLYFCLTLAKGLVGADVPDEVLRHLYPDPGSWNGWLARQLQGRMIDHLHPSRCVMLMVMARLLGPECTLDKAKWLAQFVFLPQGLWGNVPGTIRRLVFG